MLLGLIGASLALGCGATAPASTPTPEVDPHHAAAEWFEDNRGHVAAPLFNRGRFLYFPLLAPDEVYYLLSQILKQPHPLVPVLIGPPHGLTT